MLEEGAGFSAFGEAYQEVLQPKWFEDLWLRSIYYAVKQKVTVQPLLPIIHVADDVCMNIALWWGLPDGRGGVSR